MPSGEACCWELFQCQIWALCFSKARLSFMVSSRKLYCYPWGNPPSSPPQCRVVRGKTSMASPCSSPTLRNAVVHLWWKHAHVHTHRNVCNCASWASEGCWYLEWWMVMTVCVLVQLFTVFRMGQQQAPAWQSQQRGMAGTGTQLHGVGPALDVAASRVVQ